MQEIINILTDTRLLARMSQTESDEKAGVSFQTTYKFEKGLIRNVAIIEKLCQLHGYKLGIEKINL